MCSLVVVWTYTRKHWISRNISKIKTKLCQTIGLFSKRICHILQYSAPLFQSQTFLDRPATLLEWPIWRILKKNLNDTWVGAQNLKKPADSSDWRQKLWKSRQATAIMWRHITVVHDYSGTSYSGTIPITGPYENPPFSYYRNHIECAWI